MAAGDHTTRAGRRAALERARLYLILDARPDGRAASEVVGAALEGGVDVIQVRDKSAPDEAIVAAARSLRELCDEHGALLIVNDRADLALAAGADGVHVGQDDAAIAAVRAAVGPDLLVGMSTHSADQIAAARSAAVDYIGVGPVFATPTKPGRAAVGLELVRHAAAHSGHPFFAIGGIDADNAGTVIGAGATRIAVVRAIRDARDPRVAAAALRSALDVAGAVGTPA